MLVISQGRKIYKDYILIVLGTFLLALSINVFYEPFDLVTGGVSGLGIIIKSISEGIWKGGIPISVTNAVCNIPLFLIAIIVRGKNFGIKSLIATIFLTIFLAITSRLAFPVNDLLLSAVFGGVIGGVGLGMVFSAYATTGGTDLAGSLLQKLFPHVSVAMLMLVVDWTIIFTGMFVFGMQKSLYAIIAVFITARVIDAILDGLNFAKAAFIISEHQEEIAQNIMDTLERGVTGLYGRGMYSKEDKNILLCVVSKREIVKLKQIVRLADKDAFVIVTDAREVLGEGFNISDI